MEPGPMPPTRSVPAPETPVVVERLETPGTVNFDLAPQRYYVIAGFSDSRNRPGPFAGPIQIALLDPLSPPEKVDVTYTADAVSLTWPRLPEDVPEKPGAPGALGTPAAAAAAGTCAGRSRDRRHRRVVCRHRNRSDSRTCSSRPLPQKSRPAQSRNRGLPLQRLHLLRRGLVTTSTS